MTSLAVCKSLVGQLSCQSALCNFADIFENHRVSFQSVRVTQCVCVWGGGGAEGGGGG